MKIEIVDGNHVKFTPESDFEATVWKKLRKEKAQDEAEISSLKRQLKIAKHGNNFQNKILKALREYLRFKPIDNNRKKFELRHELEMMLKAMESDDE